MINVEVTRSQNESPLSLIRRFSKRIQGSGVLQQVRGNRYYKRLPSKHTRKKRALKVASIRERRLELIKLGLVQEKPEKRFGRRS